MASAATQPQSGRHAVQAGCNVRLCNRLSGRTIGLLYTVGARESESAVCRSTPAWHLLGQDASSERGVVTRDRWQAPQR